MSAGKHASRRYLKSDLVRVDAHKIKKSEYDDLPELTDDMLARATISKGGRPRSANPRKQLTLRLPADGPGRLPNNLTSGTFKRTMQPLWRTSWQFPLPQARRVPACTV